LRCEGIEKSDGENGRWEMGRMGDGRWGEWERGRWGEWERGRWGEWGEWERGVLTLRVLFSADRSTFR